MKIRLKLSQLVKIIESEPIKFPIIFKVGNFTDEELAEFSQLFQQKERS